MDQDLDRTLAEGGMLPGARSIISGEWTAPTEFSLDEGAGLLCWSTSGEPQRVASSPGLLHAFLRLRTSRGTDADILRFAQRWGPLHLCTTHYRPVTHPSTPFADLMPGEIPTFCTVQQLSGGRSAEPLAAWRLLARFAYLICEIGSRARRRELPFTTHDELIAHQLGIPPDAPSEELLAAMLMDVYDRNRTPNIRGFVNWAAKLGVSLESSEPDGQSTLLDAAHDAEARDNQFRLSISQTDALAMHVDAWIEDGGGYRQRPIWKGGPTGLPDWETGVHSLYAAIGVGLWNTIRKAAGLTPCKNCSISFIPANKTQTYCQRTECQRARKRDDQRRFRAKRAQASAN